MPTPKNDLESVCLALETFMRARLNTKLSEITTEKNDGIVLPTVPDAAYVFEYWGEEVANFNPVVLYGFAGMEAADGPGPGVVEQIRMQIGVVLNDDGSAELIRKLLRYQRALKEIFLSGWDRVAGVSNVRVSGVEPFPIALAKRDNPDRVIGVTVEFSIA